MPKLTKRTVDALQATEKDFFLWDSELPGFGVRVMPSGRKSYLIQYRDAGRRTRRKGLGKHGVVTADEARTEARAQLAAITQGSNPAEEKRKKAIAPDIAALCERFMSEHVAHRCKPSTQNEYRRNIDRFIKPALGKYKIEEVTRAQVSELHQRFHDRPYQANRNLAVLSVMFNRAELWGLRPDGSNPCRHIRKYPEKQRERYLTDAELSRLGATLQELEASGEESLASINAIRLLILTGCRLGEVLTLQWDYIREDAIWLPDSKTGAKKVYLGPATLEVLEQIERLPDNPYVITGIKPGSHLINLQKPWRRIRAKAGLVDVRIHDLRHSFASSAVGIGESLPMLGKLLGHTQPQTTARYAHLADDRMKAAASRVSSEIAAKLLVAQ
ncbi:tyrosine-type recombinase/integrase [Limibacillus halophilus]|uniref:Integrase n=1 Tax=Limibacillus halophilus TaxID=1579333 RepID=A0A839SM33_9PROT|nr:site-specific integrase [Limibacillus halophilus]MBB3063957.1 integrase [Limibacillus halophilus]